MSDWPSGVDEWIEVAQQAIDREGSVSWDDSRRIAEEVAVKLWNYLSEGLIPNPTWRTTDGPSAVHVPDFDTGIPPAGWDSRSE